MDRLIPKPTPQDIEATLTAIRNGTSAVCVWSRLCSQVIEKRDLWWVTSISPDGQRDPGGGFTLAEAAADGWIAAFLPWWCCPDLSDEDYAKVPRHVPEGWQFELDAAPVYRPQFVRSFPMGQRR